MDSSKSPRVQHSLAKKLLKKVILAALTLGLFFSITQIVLDARQSDKKIDIKAKQILAMMKEPATRAAFRLDSKMGEEILLGLLALQEVHTASIKLVNEQVLATVERQSDSPRSSHLSDFILSPSRSYETPLYKEEPYHETYGSLLLTIDTAYDGNGFIQRSIVIILSSIASAILMAVLLYLIYAAALTEPLNKVIYHLSQINPEHPGKNQLSTPKGHEHNELGLWVKTANQLLANVERNFNLRQKAEVQIIRLSHYDHLTRLPNRKALQKHLSRLLKQSKDNRENIAVICLGLDDFKSLNAQFNFNVAEHILVSLSDRLRHHLSQKAYIGRLGEDQFAIIVSKLEQPYEAAEYAQELLKLLSAPFEVNFEQITISATIGITLYPNDGNSVDRLLQQAEFAMIMAKSRSHNRYQFYIATIDSETRQRKKLEMDLHQALENHEFSLVYQPQVDFRNHQVIGAEALLRWKHPEKGLISPNTFIPMAENNLDIIPIGNWVLETACHKLHEWNLAGYNNLRIAINLSAVQLRDKQIAEHISYLLEKYQISPESLEIEVTETFILEDFELSAEQLKKIKQIGVTLALDDFGTGYSSLSYLKQFPFDKIKIDKSFVEGLPNNTENAVIVDAIILLGSSFKISVLAEGVETKAQEDYLAGHGCGEGQGYYYGKPMSETDFIEYIKNPPPFS